MSLVKWNPELGLFPNVSAWMDDFFSDSGDWPKPAIKGVSIPAVNVAETQDAFKLEVAVPGFKKEDFKIEIDGNRLKISGESKSEREDKEEKLMRREFSYQQFSRWFTLPENVHPDKISAQYTDGILLVNLPKSGGEEKQIKTIAIG